MTRFSGNTDAAHENDLQSISRAYFSVDAARLRQEILLHIETCWVAEGTPVQISLYHEESDGEREPLGEPIKGTLQDNAFEHKWKVELDRNLLDELTDPVYLWFEAFLEDHPQPIRSQPLLVHRARFSS